MTTVRGPVTLAAIGNMATRRNSRTALPPGVADLLPDLLDDIVEMWNLRTSGAVTPADVKGFVSLVVDMLPERRYCVSPSAHPPEEHGIVGNLFL